MSQFGSNSGHIVIEKGNIFSHWLVPIEIGCNVIKMKVSLSKSVERKTKFYLHEIGKEINEYLGYIEVRKGKKDVFEGYIDVNNLDINNDRSLRIGLYKNKNDKQRIDGSNVVQITIPTESDDDYKPDSILLSTVRAIENDDNVYIYFDSPNNLKGDNIGFKMISNVEFEKDISSPLIINKSLIPISFQIITIINDEHRSHPSDIINIDYPQLTELKNHENQMENKENQELQQKINKLQQEMAALNKKYKLLEQENMKYRKVKQKVAELWYIIHPNMIISAPRDDDDDDDGKTFNNTDNDELCKLLQQDLENYVVAQKKREKYPLKELRLFHENKAQIIRNWNHSLQNVHYKTILDDLLDEFEEKYEDEYDIDGEQIAYNILFDGIIECYDILHTEYIKILKNEYINPTAIDMIWINIDNFYDLMKRNKLSKRMMNIYKYIDNKMEEIYVAIKKKHSDDMIMNDDKKDKLCMFIMRCCCVIWSVLHYNFTIYPENFLLNTSDTKYDETIHEKDGGYMGDNIKYYVFPAIMKDNMYETKIWVICNDIE